MGDCDAIKTPARDILTGEAAPAQRPQIYENWRAGPHKAVIHHATCPFCNHGRGRGGGSDPENGMWHSPYASLDEASHAQQQFRVDERTEHHCVSR